MHTQFVATVFILSAKRALLLHHPKLKKWLPPGGHIENGETPPQAALRESQEEVGLDLELYCDDKISVQSPNARTFLSPYLCLEEQIPATAKEPAHVHLDLIYVGRCAKSDQPLGGEGHGARWFTLSEIQELPKTEIFADTVAILEMLLTDPRLAKFSHTPHQILSDQILAR